MTPRSLIPTPPRSASPERCTGRVMWFDPHRRIGFIEPSRGVDPVFVHLVDLRDSSPTAGLVAGQLVSYDEERGQFGPRARGVVPEAA